MGTYVGSAKLLDPAGTELADVSVSLASTGDLGEKWYGTVQGEVSPEVNGQEVIVLLPSGIDAMANITIDLTGPEPVIRLRGSGPGPI